MRHLHQMDTKQIIATIVFIFVSIIWLVVFIHAFHDYKKDD